MKISKTNFKDLLILEPIIHEDKRGVFKEVFRKDILEKYLGYSLNFCQDNQVISSSMVLRGLHFQKEPYSQSKLVSVSNGKILDVVVDIRKKTHTYGKYFSIELSSKNSKILFIPKGFAHGYLTLSDDALVNYKVDSYFNKDSDEGIPFDDKYLDIDWGVDKEKLIISEKDKNLPEFIW